MRAALLPKLGAENHYPRESSRPSASTMRPKVLALGLVWISAAGVTASLAAEHVLPRMAVFLP